jgi:tol-pal system protein YbgF
MEGRIEDLQHQVQQLQQQNKDQYLDLDSRLGKLEGQGSNPPSPAASTAPPAAAGSSAAPAPAATAASSGPPGAEEQSAYNAAFKSLQGGDYVSASRGFRTFTQDYPQSALAPNAYYWLGESYYVTQNYQVALDTFQNLLKTYPSSEKVPDALLKVGYCQAEMKNYAAAQSTLKAVIKKYPGTTVARLAQSRLRSIPARGG